ncbi:UPF0149 family protein [Luteimonas mephitis]|uniref:UPF0149 family protein n=1 Tax=Luteimonas mephitis TaxID=83615 RepID=UPI0003FE927E|nr:UPF0149 family protein [Luteimonas mephitis]
MTTSPPLQDDRIEQLAELLERRAVPFGGLGLEALDGFLSALAVGPEAIPDAEWQAVVWGGRAPRWNDDDEAREVAALLAEARELALRRACHDDDSLPDRLAPLLWLPEDPDAAQPDELDAGSDWAEGFLRAVDLREAAWDAWLDEDEWIAAILGLLDQLASGDVLDGDDPAAPSTPLTWRERIDIIGALPGMLADLQHHRIAMLTPRTPLRRTDAPERNAPCPCGSGRKFKKCCGANPASNLPS